MVRGLAARYAEPGYLLYVTENGSLMAVRFDADRLTVSGDPVPLIGGVAVWRRSGVDVEPAANGTLVYAAGAGLDRQRELIWVTRDGRVSPVDSGWIGDMRAMAVSPDGQAVAVAVRRTSGVDVWVKQLAGGAALKITDAGGQPAWMPNGRDVAFASPGGVFVGPGDGSALPRLRYPSGAAVFTQVEAAPDGKWLVGTVAGDLYALATTGDSTLVPLVRTPALERNPRLSPGGRWLAYESDESGRLEIYVRPFPDVHAAKRQISVNGGTAPRWSADGRELFFLTERLELVAVPTTLSRTFSAGTPRVLFSAGFTGQVSPYSVMPDGKRFLMMRRPGGASDAPDQLIVVEGFVQELKSGFAR
jgi:serine/threonine-protein kinase